MVRKGRRMRILVAVLALLAIGLVRADAAPPPFHAAVVRVTVQDAVPFDTLIAYPTDAAEVPFQAGPFTIAASRDAPIASGKPFPIVLFSHGNGRRGGTSLIHRDLVLSLARQGFIVVAPSHPGTSNPLQDRPRQIHKALDRVFTDQRFAGHADHTRLAVMGFSFGGAVALVVAGATPSLAHLSAYCRGRTDDPRACDGAPAEVPPSDLVPGKSADALPLKAIVLLEPFGALFDPDGLKPVDMPVLLYRAEHSDLAAEGNILALASALPRPPLQETTPGGHFIFIDPCPPLLEAEVPAVCKDAPGLDRAAAHQRIEVEIASFLRQNL
jgi:predicted dienelactone hydrolase